jgi:SAM-dependent MidA family methyltransferase
LLAKSAPHPKQLTEAAEKIAAEIRDKGPMSFARFMRVALYCPVCGYYEKEEDTIGREGDYYTSVSVGRLFGELLAFQFAEWLAENQKSTVHGAEGVQVVEAGAHNGELARDILGWLQAWRAELFARLEYCIVEPSDRRREQQQRALREFADRVRWVKSLAELGGARQPSPVACNSPGVRRIIFANELLDALPVHRLGWEAKERVWFEWGVSLKGGRFVWTRLSGQAAGVTGHAWLASLDPQLSALLPDGFTVEVCPAAEEWWYAAASMLERGKLLTIDYGLTAEEFLTPARKGGTLRGYRHHRLSSDVLAHPGEEDITAHVNFTAIQAAGESAGLETEVFLTQSQFLTRVAAQIWNGQGSFGEWTAEQTRQFQTLTHPEHLGRSFRVLVQGRS